MKKVHAMHGRDHLPNGADPIPGRGSYAWIRRTTRLAVGDGIVTTIVAYDTGDTSAGGGIFTNDLALGQIQFNETGLYLAEFKGWWRFAVTNPTWCSVAVAVSPGGSIAQSPQVVVQNPQYANPGSSTLATRELWAQMLILVTVLDGTAANNHFYGRIGNASGASQDLDEAAVTVTKLA